VSAGRPKSRLSHEERIRARLGGHFDDLGKRPDTELAALIGVTHERVRQYRALLGIPTYRKPAHPHQDAIVAAWNTGKSLGVIAKELGIARFTVGFILQRAKRRGAPIRIEHSSVRLPAGHPPRRWTPATIEPIRQLWLQGITLVELVPLLGRKNVASVSAWVHHQRQAGYDFPKRKPNQP